MKIGEARLVHMRAAAAQNDAAIQFMAIEKPFDTLARSIVFEGQKVQPGYIELKMLFSRRSVSERQLLAALRTVSDTLSTLHAIGIAHGGITDRDIYINPTTSHALLSLKGARGVSIDRDERAARPDWMMSRMDYASGGVPFEVLYKETNGKPFDGDLLMHDASPYIKRIWSDLALYDVACLGHAFEGGCLVGDVLNENAFRDGNQKLSGAITLMITPRFIGQGDTPCECYDEKKSLLSRPSMNNVRKIIETAIQSRES